MTETVFIVSMVAVGITEWVKNFLPENISSKVLSAISVGIAVASAIGYGIYTSMPLKEIANISVLTVGISQTSYNFILKLLKDKLTNWQSTITQND